MNGTLVNPSHRARAFRRRQAVRALKWLALYVLGGLALLALFAAAYLGTAALCWALSAPAGACDTAPQDLRPLDPELFYTTPPPHRAPRTAHPEPETDTLARILANRPRIEPGWAGELAALIDAQAAPGGELAEALPAGAPDARALIAELAFLESGYRADALNKSTRCAGLLQLHPCHGVADPCDPAANLEFGCALLARYVGERGSLRRGLHRWGLKDSQARLVIRRAQTEAAQ